MPKQTLFISDLHLDQCRPQITATFLYFLREIAPQAEALYILGDFFETYVGDDDNSELIQTINAALLEATQSGLLIYFMPGNRDFMVGPLFSKKTGVTRLPDPTKITLYGEPILLMHGDSLCTLDSKHQRFRKITSFRWLQWLFLKLPLKTRQNIGHKMRASSQTQQSGVDSSIMDVTQSAVICAMQKHGVQRLIHGHTHQCATHQFKINGISAQRIVLDAWHTKGSYLSMRENKEIAMTVIPAQAINP